MSIIIRGMEMPKNGETITITICDDGIVFEERKEPGSVFEAIPVPPHGDLVERQAVLNTFSIHMNRTRHFVTIRDTVPTVIEAEEE